VLNSTEGQDPSAAVLAACTPAEQRMLPPLAPDRADCIDCLKASVTESNVQLRQDDMAEQDRTMEAARTRQQKLIATKPKQAHKQIFKKSSNIRGVPGLTNEQGDVVTDPVGVLGLAAKWWARRRRRRRATPWVWACVWEGRFRLSSPAFDGRSATRVPPGAGCVGFSQAACRRVSGPSSCGKCPASAEWRARSCAP